MMSKDWKKKILENWSSMQLEGDKFELGTSKLKRRSGKIDQWIAVEFKNVCAA